MYIPRKILMSIGIVLFITDVIIKKNTTLIASYTP